MKKQWTLRLLNEMSLTLIAVAFLVTTIWVYFLVVYRQHDIVATAFLASGLLGSVTILVVGFGLLGLFDSSNSWGGDDGLPFLQRTSVSGRTFFALGLGMAPVTFLVILLVLSIIH